MNLKQLLFAQSVAETHSFSQSAAACHATQPTLSNAISQLEDELGGKLFVRTTRKVGLTAFGKYMLPYIQAVLEGRAELEKAAETYHNPEHKLLRIGLSPLIDMKLLSQVLEPYRQAHPEVSVFFKECLLDDLNVRMANEQIDFAVIPQRNNTTEQSTCFFYEEPLYYLPQENSSSHAVSFQYKVNELPEAQIIMTGGGCGLNGALETIFQNEHLELKPYPGQALSYRVIEEWASLGIGAAILPKAKLSSDNKMAAPLVLSDGKPATFSYEWVWNTNALTRKDISDFVEYVTATIPVLISGTVNYSDAV